MTDKEAIAAAKAWVKRDFDIDLNDDEAYVEEGAVLLDFRDYDLNRFGDYHESEYIDECRYENDGRCEYLAVTAELNIEDYFG